MLRYALKRVFIGFLCVLGVSLIIFVSMRLTGDPTHLLLPEDATQEDFAKLRAEMGLDKPIPVQYLIFIKEAAQGNFGRSFRWKRPAMGMVLERLPATLQLGSFAFILAITFGLLAGVTSAKLRGSPYDLAVRVTATMGLSVPGFWLGIMLILVVAVQLGWLPTSGRGSFLHLILPGLTMAWHSQSAMSRLSRSAMLNVLGSDYIKMARVKGNPEWRVLWKHGLKNAAIPVVTLAGIQLANMVGHTVVVETIFAWPGIGKLIIDAIYARDFAVVQAGIVLVSIVYISLNILVDLLYGYLDPQIRYD
ncbi:MAG: ABC transporter permease [Deltaproteobacteria bacterium]|nr:ABC transporter permease [Deltaproteobacteria bacterium]